MRATDIHRLLPATGLVLILALAACDSPPTLVSPDENPPVESQRANEASVAPASAAPSEAAAPSEFAVGDKIELSGNQYFTVHEVTLWPGNDFFTPAEGNKIISVRVEIEGIAAEGASYNPFYFSVKDEEGFEYNATFTGQEPTLQSGNDLAPGDVVAGWVSFEVPVAVANLTMEYQPDLFGSESVRVNLVVPAS